ncbi:TolB family protein [Paenibacillus albidus]|uniref:TolB family protein n=1 Tax=Paenibacillus albidus TaxID=2041023 RepID=UPI001BEAB281|nr:PD40 domain-containing protein [Paenibacillus albidus]MBT2291533.1 TolB family protein [Paenibacillus albidus]
MEMSMPLHQLYDRNTFSVLETLDIYTGERTILKEFNDIIEAPNWTKDNRFLVYNSNGCMFTYELESGNVNKINTGFATICNNDHVLSPDGKLLAISHFTEEDFVSRIYVLPIEGGEPRLVTPNGPSYLHGWSPDSSTLAYCAERNGQYDIYSIPVDGGQELQVTNHTGLDDGPEYSPCGRWIYFNSTRSGLMQIWRIGTDGGSAEKMTFEEANCWFPHVSPDGQWVVYLAYEAKGVAPEDHPANKQVELRLMPANSGASRTIARLFGGQGTINVNSWAPDSRKLAFVSYRLKQ